MMNTRVKHPSLEESSLATCHMVTFVAPDGQPQEAFSAPCSGIVIKKLFPGRNGVEQVAATLSQCPNLRSVHIYTKGEPGRLELGNITLTVDNIEQYAWDLQSWFSATPSFITPFLFLNACNVGDGDRGLALIDKLHRLTGSHIRYPNSSSDRHLQLI